MPIKQYNPTSQQWEDYNEELVNESVGRCYVNGIYRVAWRGLHAHNGIRFTRWTSTNSLPTTAGNYVLMNDVTLSSTWTVPVGTTNLCLNGRCIKQTVNASVITIPSGSNLKIHDCNVKNIVNQCVGYLPQETQATTNLSISGGIITGGSNANGGGIYVKAGGNFSLYGGSIVGNRATQTADKGGGGGVYCEDNGTFSMYGGSVCNNWSYCQGGGIYTIFGTLNIYDGVITKNGAGRFGGGGLHGDKIINIYGGEISYNYANSHGGGVHTADKSAITTITGGIIKNNTAKKYGGGINIEGAKLYISNAIIINNSTSGTTDSFGGGIAMRLNPQMLRIINCTITNNNAQRGAGGVYIDGGTFEISGKNTITNNLYGNSKNNVNLRSNVKMKLINKLESGSEIGVTMQTPGVFTTYYSTYNEESPDTFFSSDSASYRVTLASGEAKLVSV